MPGLAAAWAALGLAQHKARFYRAWHAGYRAGLPHPRILADAAAVADAPAVAALAERLRAGTARGETVADLAQKLGDALTPFEVGLLRLGDEAGRLESVLALLGRYFETEHRLQLDVRRKLAYPLINGMAAVAIAPLPLLVFGRPWAYLLTVAVGLTAAVLAGGGVLLAVGRWFAARPRYVRARLLRALTAGVEAGLPLDRVVTLAVAAAGDPALAAHVARQSARARGSQTLVATFRGAPGLPPELFAAFEVADASGDYAGTLGKLAQLYDGDWMPGRRP